MGPFGFHTCQPPEYGNLETSRNLSKVRLSFSTMSEYFPKITRRSSGISRRSSSLWLKYKKAFANRANFLPRIVQCSWLISDQIRYSLNVYQFVCFTIEKSSNKVTLLTVHFLFYFPFWHLENVLKKATLGISTGICIVALTGRFDETLGNSRENRESWQVC